MANKIKFTSFENMVSYFINSIKDGDVLEFVGKKETKTFRAEKLFFDTFKYTYEASFNDIPIKSTFSSKDKTVILHYLGLF